MAIKRGKKEIRTSFSNITISLASPEDVLAKATKKGDAYYNSLGTTSGTVKNFISLGSSAHGVFDAQVYMQNYYELDYDPTKKFLYTNSVLEIPSL